MKRINPLLFFTRARQVLLPLSSYHIGANFAIVFLSHIASYCARLAWPRNITPEFTPKQAAFELHPASCAAVKFDNFLSNFIIISWNSSCDRLKFDIFMSNFKISCAFKLENLTNFCQIFEARPQAATFLS